MRCDLSKTLRRALGLACVLVLTSPTWAIQPDSWTQTTESDFDAGKTHNTVVTNLGDVKLAAASKTLAKAPEESSIFSDLQVVGQTVYIAAGPKGKLLKRSGGQLEEIATPKNKQIFTLATYHGKLLVGLSGKPSRLAVLEEGKLKTLATFDGKEDDAVRYIWDILVEKNGDVYLATGDNGRVLRLKAPALTAALNRPAPTQDHANAANTENQDEAGADSSASDAAETGGPDEAAGDAETTPQATAAPEAGSDATGNAGGKPAAAPKTPYRVVLNAKQANILCLGEDGKGRLYAGTDTDGLVYRITPGKGQNDANGKTQTFVIYDAPEPEIGALLVEKDGTVYAGTANAKQAKPGRLEEAASEKTGRPAVSGGAAQAGEEKPAEPGELPQVPPGAKPIGQPKEGQGGGGGGGGGNKPGGGSEKPGAGQSSGQSAPATGPARTGGSTAAGGAPTEQRGAKAPAGAASQQPSAEAQHEPTPEQFDQLRQVIRHRLEKARESGRMQLGGAGQSQHRQVTPAGNTLAPPVSSSSPEKKGNAIYRIDPQGFVTEVFRESVMILNIQRLDGRLLVATGNEGQIFRVDPRTRETTTVVDLDAQQVPAMTVGPDGNMLLATANPARLLRLGETVADHGNYTSKVMDAGQVSLWGVLEVTARIPKGASLAIRTRSGNVQDPDQAPWSKWSSPQKLTPNGDPPLQPRAVKVTAPPARFVQYRLMLTGTRQASPTVNQVRTNYVTPNMKPRISSITASYSDTSDDKPPATKMDVKWKAKDANKDTLVYRLDYRPSGSEKWLKIEKDLDDDSYQWQTRRVPDGRYRLRVTADDRPDNPGRMAMTARRLSDPILVDNTPPALKGLKASVQNDSVKMSATAADQLSHIHDIAYTVDAKNQYKPILPNDLILDSTAEKWNVTIPDLSAGPHVLTVRVRDARGNTTYRSINVTIGKQQEAATES